MQREENCNTEQERHKEVNFRSLYIKNTNIPPPRKAVIIILRIYPALKLSTTKSLVLQPEK